MLIIIALLIMIFFLYNGGNKAVCPDLPMRMGLRAAHAFAFVLKHLNPRVTQTKLFRLRHPCGDDLLNFFQSELWQGAAVIIRVDITANARVGRTQKTGFFITGQ